MVKVLSLISFSMLSAMLCDMASASSCSYSFVDSDEFDSESESHSLHSACFDLNASNDKKDHKHEKMNSDDFSDHYHYFKSKDDDDEHTDGKSESSGKSVKGGNSENYSEHDFDWSGYKLDYHEHDGSGMFDHDDDKGRHEYEDHHAYNGHHDGEHWHKHEEHYRLPKYNETAVPVPAAFWLFGSGLITLLMASRRKFLIK